MRPAKTMHLLNKYGGHTKSRSQAESDARPPSPSLISALKILNTHLASLREQGLGMTVLFGWHDVSSEIVSTSSLYILIWIRDLIHSGLYLFENSFLEQKYYLCLLWAWREWNQWQLLYGKFRKIVDNISPVCVPNLTGSGMLAACKDIRPELTSTVWMNTHPLLANLSNTSGFSCLETAHVPTQTSRSCLDLIELAQPLIKANQGNAKPMFLACRSLKSPF